jgi:hypothetical protein
MTPAGPMPSGSIRGFRSDIVLTTSRRERRDVAAFGLNRQPVGRGFVEPRGFGPVLGYARSSRV